FETGICCFISSSLIDEENRRLQRLLDERNKMLNERDEMLNEKELELQNAADIIKALSDRLEQFQRDNSSLREQLASSDSTSKILSAISNNIQRILRDSDVENCDDLKVTSQSIPKIIEPIRPHSRTLNKPMNPNLSPFSSRQIGIAGKRDLQYAKREAAVKDVIMEDSDESETDEFFDHNNNNISNNQIMMMKLPMKLNMPRPYNSSIQSSETLKEAEVYNKTSPRRLRRYRGDSNEPSTITVEQSKFNSTEGSGKNGQPVLSSSQQIPLKLNGNVSNPTQQRSQP
ncbi:32152_t:CDS:2, partial [Racocetra persica]